MCFTKDGFLVVAESNRILHFPAAEYFYEGPDVAVGVVVPEGKLIPVEEQSFNHTGRVCKVASDGKIYVTLGQPYNVQPADKVALFESLGIGGVLRFNGQKLPYFAWRSNAMWDDSELQHVLDSLTNCDTATRGIATV